MLQEMAGTRVGMAVSRAGDFFVMATQKKVYGGLLADVDPSRVARLPAAPPVVSESWVNFAGLRRPRDQLFALGIQAGPIALGISAFRFSRPAFRPDGSQGQLLARLRR